MESKQSKYPLFESVDIRVLFDCVPDNNATISFLIDQISLSYLFVMLCIWDIIYIQNINSVIHI